MPASAIIGAGAQVAGAAIGGKGASKAAKIQAQTADKQMALAREFQAGAESRYAGDIARGDRAQTIYSGLIGTGGDPAASAAAYNAWRNSTGYQSQMRDGLAAVNANAYAKGYGQSGAAFRALQDRGNDLAQQSFGTYASLVDRQVQNAVGAKDAITGAGRAALGANTQALQSSADARSGSALAQGALWSNAINNIGSIASSSYKGGVK